MPLQLALENHLSENAKGFLLKIEAACQDAASLPDCLLPHRGVVSKLKRCAVLIHRCAAGACDLGRPIEKLLCRWQLRRWLLGFAYWFYWGFAVWAPERDCAERCRSARKRLWTGKRRDPRKPAANGKRMISKAKNLLLITLQNQGNFCVGFFYISSCLCYWCFIPQSQIQNEFSVSSHSILKQNMAKDGQASWCQEPSSSSPSC